MWWADLSTKGKIHGMTFSIAGDTLYVFQEKAIQELDLSTGKVFWCLPVELDEIVSLSYSGLLITPHTRSGKSVTFSRQTGEIVK